MKNEKYEIPTREEIYAYLKNNGYPHPETDDKWMVESFVLPDNYDRRFQFWQAVAENIALCDFDRWQHFENVINHEIPYEDFLKIDNILCEYDIEILELTSNKSTLW